MNTLQNYALVVGLLKAMRDECSKHCQTTHASLFAHADVSYNEVVGAFQNLMQDPSAHANSELSQIIDVYLKKIGWFVQGA